MTTEELVQEAILEDLNDAIAPDVVEQSIPDPRTVRRNQHGDIDPYVAIQFGDLQQGANRSFVGPRGDDYILPVYVQTVAGSASLARRIANKVRNAMLGNVYSWSGNIRKRAGGPMYPIVASNNATEAYVQPISFGVVIQYGDLDTDELE